MILIFLNLIYNCSAFGYDKKKFGICLLTVWSSTLFILLVNISNHPFNLFINNVVTKPVIESLFYVFYLFIKYCSEERIRLTWDIRLLLIAFLYLKGHSLLKLRVRELLSEVFFCK